MGKRTGRPPKPAVTRFESHLVGFVDCWIWDSGRHYPCFRDDTGRMVSAHRWSYEYHRGPVPEGLVLDHLCRNPSCVNAWHVEPVTQQVNVLRGVGWSRIGEAHAAKTHCPYGHPYTPDNVRPFYSGKVNRVCIACSRARGREYARKKRAAAAAGSVG